MARTPGRMNLGPWRGVRNIGELSDPEFQLPAKEDGPRPFLSAASNCALNHAGLPRPLPYLRKIRDYTGASALFSRGGMLLAREGNSLWLLNDPGDDTQDVLLIDDALSPTGTLVAHEWPTGASRVWLTDGESHWQIRDGTVHAWGLKPDTPVLTAISGGLQAGPYLVAVAYRDRPLSIYSAQESHIESVEPITLTRTGGIQVDVTVTDPNASYAVVYCSPVAQPELSLVGIANVVEQPDHSRTATLTITTQPRLNDMLALGLDFSGPPAGITALGSCGSWLLAGVGTSVYRSQSGAPQWFDLDRRRQTFAGEVRGIVGIGDGWYCGTEKGLYWVSGDGPENWAQRRIETDEVLRGGRAVDCRLFPSVQYEGLGALFATRTGLMLGLPQGVVRRLTQDHWHFPTGDSATFAVREAGAERQVWVGT